MRRIVTESQELWLPLFMWAKRKDLIAELIIWP